MYFLEFHESTKINHKEIREVKVSNEQQYGNLEEVNRGYREIYFNPVSLSNVFHGIEDFSFD